jgi:Leucine-rich repeat (LRR) protein
MTTTMAAVLLVAAAHTAFGVALLRGQSPAPATQQPVPDIAWTECHGPAALAAVAADVKALKCFDFDDDACAQLARFTKLERLDLSGTDVDDKGSSIPPRTTDMGVRELVALKNLRWLCLARCHAMNGDGLQALEALPLLEHLDLTSTGVETPAIERLQRLPSLRSLVLSHCPKFHGRALAAVAKIPGLRRLELRACPTLTADDVMHVAKLKELRHLDLRDCQGRFRGQREFLPGPGGKAPEPPIEDGVGITDEVVAAIAALPLETLLLGGCESLTDAIAGPIAKLSTLRNLDVSNLPNVTGALLATLPGELEALALDDNPQFDTEALRRLPPLANVREIGLAVFGGLDRATLEALLANKQLTSLRLGRGAFHSSSRPALLRGADLAVLATQKQLRSLVLGSTLVDKQSTTIVAALPQLTELDLSRGSLAAHVLAPLGACASLRSLKLAGVQMLDIRTLRAIPGAQLRELDLYGTNAPSALIRETAKTWKGCTITMPDGRRWRTP